MEFVAQHYQPGETIAAIATPPGEGGVAIIRIAGKEAVEVADRVFSGEVASYQTHTAHYGQVVNGAGEVIDDVLVIPMLGNRSYTGEDTVEIHCHGGSLVTRRVLDVVLVAGARAALPGEFTFKGFINGKFDLTQAEAVQELIAAKSERALDAAERQLHGSLTQRVQEFQRDLTQIAAILEAWVDFPEEGLEFASEGELLAQLQQCREQMQQLADTFHQGKILHEGLSLCLVGAPNVGKSSLMNALLDKERAIVSQTPGTTRDVLEDQLRLNGLNLRLLDTAGIRTTEESIEQEGIRRTQAAMAETDLILFILDASRPLLDEEKTLITQLPKEKTIVVWNKIDLPHNGYPTLDMPYTVPLSAKERKGLETLHKQIDSVIWKEGPPSKEEVILTNIRHKEALVAAIESCQRVHHGLQEAVSPEFLTLDMRQGLQALGKIIGTDITEDVLSSIFSTFCIGK